MNRTPDPEVIEAVSLVRVCQALRCLPLPGGLYDQDWLFVEVVGMVLEADAKKAEREAAAAKVKR